MPKNQFHVNPAGEPGPCSAEVSCPFGSNDEHFNTRDEARVFYEKKNASTVLPKTMSKSELNKAVKDSTDPELLLHGAVNGTDRTRGNLVKNPNATSESLVAIRESTEDEYLKLNAQLHSNFPVEKLDDEALDHVKKLLNTRFSYGGNQKEYNEARQTTSRIVTAIYQSNSLTDDEFDRVTERLENKDYQKYAVTNPDNKLSVNKIVSIAESDPEDKNDYLLESVIKNNPKYPVADRIEHLSPRTVQNLAGSLKDPQALRNIVKYPPYKSTRQQTIYRLAINRHAPSDVLEAVAKEDPSADTGLALYKHPNATPELKKSLTGRSEKLRVFGKFDELREKNPELMKELESVKKIEDPSDHTKVRHQFDPELLKRTQLTDDEVEFYAKDNFGEKGKFDPETKVYTYNSGYGAAWKHFDR